MVMVRQNDAEFFGIMNLTQWFANVTLLLTSSIDDRPSPRRHDRSTDNRRSILLADCELQPLSPSFTKRQARLPPCRQAQDLAVYSSTGALCSWVTGLSRSWLDNQGRRASPYLTISEVHSERLNVCYGSCMLSPL
jgi:hypothetical protein